MKTLILLMYSLCLTFLFSFPAHGEEVRINHPKMICTYRPPNEHAVNFKLLVGTIGEDSDLMIQMVLKQRYGSEIYEYEKPLKIASAREYGDGSLVYTSYPYSLSIHQQKWSDGTFAGDFYLYEQHYEEFSCAPSQP
jgi:hypothetical protein